MRADDCRMLMMCVMMLMKGQTMSVDDEWAHDVCCCMHAADDWG